MNPNLTLIFLCLMIGIALRLTQKFPERTPQVLNSIVIWVSLPALILIQIPLLLRDTKLQWRVLIPISMAWITILLSFLFFHSIGKWRGWSAGKTGALILTAGLGNTSFVGFPLLESLYGNTAIQVGVLVDQPGTFLVLSTAGLVIASLFSQRPHPSPDPIEMKLRVLKNVISFPPFVALITATLWFYSGTFYSGTFHLSALTISLERLSATLVPLALIAVGFQLRVSPKILRRQWKPLLLGLSFKLFLLPLFFTFLYLGAFSLGNFSTLITIIESAMAPMISAAVISEEFGLDSEIANLMVGIGIPLSLLTVNLWSQLDVLHSLAP